MDITDILNLLPKLTPAKVNKAELARALEIDPAALRRKELAKIELKLSEIEKIEKAYKVSLIKRNNSDDCIEIPVRGEICASMGTGVEIYDEEKTGTYALSRKLANDLGIKANNADIIFGTGNSMEPTIKGGDALLVDKNRCEVCDGKIYCIRQDGQLKVKRLQRLSKTKIKIISDNKDYEAITLDLAHESENDFLIIGEIRWCGRIFL